MVYGKQIDSVPTGHKYNLIRIFHYLKLSETQSSFTFEVKVDTNQQSMPILTAKYEAKQDLFMASDIVRTPINNSSTIVIIDKQFTIVDGSTRYKYCPLNSDKNLHHDI